MADIGIMGGTFDPIHQAHLIIAEQARIALNLDKVWFLPSGNPPHKTKREITDKKIRCEMVKVAISDNPYFELCDYEINKEEYSYTAKTLEYLKSENCNDNFYLIIGEDSLAYLEKWYKPEIIVKLACIAVYGRGENSKLDYEIKRIKNLLGADIKKIEAPLVDLSSTAIRESVKNKQSVKYQLPDSVIEIINREKLYLQE